MFVTVMSNILSESGVQVKIIRKTKPGNKTICNHCTRISKSKFREFLIFLCLLQLLFEHWNHFTHLRKVTDGRNKGEGGSIETADGHNLASDHRCSKSRTEKPTKISYSVCAHSLHCWSLSCDELHGSPPAAASGLTEARLLQNKDFHPQLQSVCQTVMFKRQTGLQWLNFQNKRFGIVQ